MEKKKKTWWESTLPRGQVFTEAVVQIHWPLFLKCRTIFEMRDHLEESDMARCSELVCWYGRLFMGFKGLVLGHCGRDNVEFIFSSKAMFPVLEPILVSVFHKEKVPYETCCLAKGGRWDSQ